jgi:hypothetical protein
MPLINGHRAGVQRLQMDLVFPIGDFGQIGLVAGPGFV